MSVFFQFLNSPSESLLLLSPLSALEVSHKTNTNDATQNLRLGLGLRVFYAAPGTPKPGAYGVYATPEALFGSTTNTVSTTYDFLRLKAYGVLRHTICHLHRGNF